MAYYIGRVFQTNVPSVTSEGIPWRAFVEKLNPNLRTPPKPDPQFYPYTGSVRSGTRPPPSSSSPPSRFSSSRSPTPDLQPAPPSPESYAEGIEQALDLLEQLLHPESVRRITPRKALYHPFLQDPDEPADDDVCPNPFTEGVCGSEHFYDEKTDEPCVTIYGSHGEVTVKKLVAGEGIAIGKQPCEFHRNWFEDRLASSPL